MYNSQSSVPTQISYKALSWVFRVSGGDVIATKTVYRMLLTDLTELVHQKDSKWSWEYIINWVCVLATAIWGNSNKSRSCFLQGSAFQNFFWIIETVTTKKEALFSSGLIVLIINFDWNY